ncbi:MAG: hypothetical protein QXU18_12495, partial [Thermoplasmatales archaeon]
TTDGYHYESVLKEVSSCLNVRISRQRCLFHMEKDLAHRIRDARKESELDGAKNIIRYMFFHNETNLKKLGKSRDAILNLTRGNDEKEIVDLVMDKIRSPCGDDRLISDHLRFVKKHRNEVFQ